MAKAMKLPMKKVVSDTTYSKLPEGGFKTTITDRYKSSGGGTGMKKPVAKDVYPVVKKDAYPVVKKSTPKQSSSMTKVRVEENPGMKMSISSRSPGLNVKTSVPSTKISKVTVPSPKPAANKTPVRRNQETFKQNPIGVVGSILSGRKSVGKSPRGENVYATKQVDASRGGNMKTIKKR